MWKSFQQWQFQEKIANKMMMKNDKSPNAQEIDWA